MQADECCSSKGRSCGPESHSMSCTHQPSPEASSRGRMPIAHHSRATAIFPKLAPRRRPYDSTQGNTRSIAMPATFNDALHSQGPAADRAGKLELYGWLVGDWEMDGILYRDDGTKYQAKGEI